MPIVLKHQKLSAFSIYNKVYYKLFSKSALPSLINLITNSPNSVFCHANHHHEGSYDKHLPPSQPFADVTADYS